VNAKVPLLEHGDGLVVESDVVAKYIAQNIGRHHTEEEDGDDYDAMYPVADAEIRGRIDNFLATWYPVVDSYYSYLCASSELSAKSALLEFRASLQLLERELPEVKVDSSSTNGNYFCLGNTFSVAECIAAPWIQRFYVTLPYFRGVDFEKDVLPPECTKVCRWANSVRARSSVVKSACPEDEMLAAARRYYVSFVSPGAPGKL